MLTRHGFRDVTRLLQIGNAKDLGVRQVCRILDRWHFNEIYIVGHSFVTFSCYVHLMHTGDRIRSMRQHPSSKAIAIRHAGCLIQTVAAGGFLVMAAALFALS